VSAVTVIYVIREDLSRRTSIANPVLRLLRDYIINMAINLDLYVANPGKRSSINNKLISKDEDTILDAMNTLHKNMKDMSEKKLNEEEKKAIRAARRGFCDDITHILKRVDYVLDKVSGDDVPEFISYSKILETNEFHIGQLFKFESEHEEFECALLRAYTQSFEMCIKIYNIVVKALKG
jgi:hypothetical protein